MQAKDYCLALERPGYLSKCGSTPEPPFVISVNQQTVNMRSLGCRGAQYEKAGTLCKWTEPRACLTREETGTAAHKLSGCFVLWFCCLFNDLITPQW